MKIEIPYYEDNTRISNSAIGWYLEKGPRYLKDMLDGKEEGIKAKYLEKGTMIHMYILQPDEFWDNYTVLDFESPKVKQQKDFCDYYGDFRKVEPLEAVDVLSLKAYRMAYSNSLKDEVVLEKARELRETYADYIEYLGKRDTKNVISFADLNMLKTIKANIDEHKQASVMLADAPGEECHNEFHINWEYEKENISCKSLLDRVKFDHNNRKISIIDLKTTADIQKFKDSVEKYDYYRQLTFYSLAVTWYFLDQGIDISDYSFECYIIAIQSTGDYEVKVFNMKNEPEMVLRTSLISKALSDISYHFQTGNWSHSRNYYEGNGIEELGSKN